MRRSRWPNRTCRLAFPISGGQLQRVIIFGLLSVLSVGHGVIVAQGVSESALGAWTLNRAKSTFSGAVPERRVTKFEVVGDAIKETT